MAKIAQSRVKQAVARAAKARIHPEWAARANIPEVHEELFQLAGGSTGLGSIMVRFETAAHRSIVIFALYCVLSDLIHTVCSF